jgi:hypothetical protein
MMLFHPTFSVLASHSAAPLLKAGLLVLPWFGPRLIPFYRCITTWLVCSKNIKPDIGVPL